MYGYVTLKDTTTPGQSKLGSIDNEDVHSSNH